MSEAATAEVVQIDAVAQAFDENVSQYGTDDGEHNIKMAMINAGSSFASVNSTFKKLCVAAGLTMSRAERDKIVHDIVDGYNLNEKDTFDTLVGELVDAIAGATIGSASALIRSYAKKHELDCYKKPKGTGSRSSFQEKFHNWIVDSEPFPTKDDAQNYINAHGTKNAIKRMPRYMSEWNACHRIYLKHTS